MDDFVAKAKFQDFHTLVQLGIKGVNYATTPVKVSQ
jgi:hypothetical protein